MSPKEVKLLVDSICTVLKRWYILPESSAKIIHKVNTAYKNGEFDKIPGRTELAAQLTADIQAAHKDPHMKIGYFPELARDSFSLAYENKIPAIAGIFALIVVPLGLTPLIQRRAPLEIAKSFLRQDFSFIHSLRRKVNFPLVHA
jgi:hypothetical protein